MTEKEIGGDWAKGGRNGQGGREGGKKRKVRERERGESEKGGHDVSSVS